MNIYVKDRMVVGISVVGSVLFIRTAIYQKDGGPETDLLMLKDGEMVHVVPEKWDDSPNQVSLSELPPELAEAAYNLEMSCFAFSEAYVG